MQIDETLAGETEVFEPRQLGDHLLVGQLGSDALGTVYRALDSADERRFVRLRVLQSGEMSPEAVFAAIEKNARPCAALVHEAIVRRSRLGVADGTPFLAWHETAGWTLDAVLARARALKLQIPTEHALLIADRVAAALEHTHLTVLDGTPAHHGLLWPGFVSVSNDAEVRVGGFGLAEAVLPSLHKPRLAHEIAPYIAPEVREEGRAGASSDVYSFGMVLLELLTCRRPSLAAPLPLRAEDPLSEEIGAFLRLCLGAPAERLPTAVAMRRALRELLAAGRYSLSNASLTLFLYRLLNPESRSGGAFTDGDSTVPILFEPVPARVPSVERNLSQLSVTPPSSEIVVASRQEARGDRTLRAGAGVLVLFLAAASLTFLLMRRPRLEGGPTPAATPRAAAEVEAVPLGNASAPEEAPASTALSEPVDSPLPAPASKPLPPQRPPSAARESAAAIPAAFTKEGLAGAMASARSSRFQAGLARVEAERLDAPTLAADLFVEGQNREKEGDRLVHTRDYEAARLAFLQAAQHFRRAEGVSREERVRRLDLASLR